MKASAYKAGIAVTALAAGAGIFGFAATASAASTLPTVTKLSTNKGSTLGGTVVTITGTNLDTASAVDFGGTPGTGLLILSPTQVAVVSPIGTGTVAQVKITNSTGVSVATLGTFLADDFNYVVPANATLAASSLLNPTGKTALTVGSSLALGANATALKALKVTATINGVVAPVTYKDANNLTVTVPAGTPSNTPVSVKLFHDGVAGAVAPTATNTAKYAAVITKLSKAVGPVAGGGDIIVTGKGITTSAGAIEPGTWTFGSVTATCVALSPAKVDNVKCTVPAPSVAGTAGPVLVKFAATSSVPFGATSNSTYTYTDLG